MLVRAAASVGSGAAAGTSSGNAACLTRLARVGGASISRALGVGAGAHGEERGLGNGGEGEEGKDGEGELVHFVDEGGFCELDFQENIENKTRDRS